MSVRQSINIALHALTSNKLRAGLTMLGIIIGVGAVIGLLSIGEGARAAILQEIQGIGSNLIFVVPGDMRAGSAFSRSIGSAVLTLDDAAAIADPTKCPSVAAVAPEYQHAGEVVYRNVSLYTDVVGTTPEFQEIRNYYPRQGQFFTNQDVAAASRVAAIGADVAEELFGGEDPIGQIVRINRLPFRVTAVFEKQGMSRLGDTRDRVVVVPINTATRLFRSQGLGNTRSDILTSINISALDEARVDSAISEITALLRERHRIQYDNDDFTVTSQKDVLDLMGSVTNVLTTFLGAIAAISLLVGGIGIMNIMFVSVTERTREIGLRKAIGARSNDILAQFLIEAVILSLVGGAVGILVGMGLSVLVNLTGAFVAQLSLQAIVMAVGFSVAVGLFFGIYPARRAASLHPIEALRYE
jgi:putative ABC transport system permease protein